MNTTVQGVGAKVVVSALAGAPQVGTQITVGSSAAVQCNGGTTPTVLALQGVTLQADPTNTGTVYVGLSTVASNLCLAALAAGQSVLVPTNDPANLWVKGSATGQKVNQSWI